MVTPETLQGRTLSVPFNMLIAAKTTCLHLLLDTSLRFSIIVPRTTSKGKGMYLFRSSKLMCLQHEINVIVEIGCFLPVGTIVVNNNKRAVFQM